MDCISLVTPNIGGGTGQSISRRKLIIYAFRQWVAAALLGRTFIRHHYDIRPSVARSLDNRPPEARVKQLCARSVEVKPPHTKRCRIVNAPPDQRCADAVPPMVGSDENAGQPWRQFHARVHIICDQHSRAEQCATGERDYDCRYFSVATRSSKSGGACLE